MTNLEFINGQIEIFDRRIKFLNNELDNKHTGIVDPLKLDLTTEEIQIALSQTTQVLQTLNQIKTILEAWEVVKPYVDIIDKYTPYPTWQLKPNYDECKLKETNILIKALEVSDD